MKNTKTTTLPSTLYIMLTDEAAKHCVRAGCSFYRAMDNVLEVEKELARKGFRPRKNAKI